MKDITIKIIGRRYNGEEMEDELEFVSDGTMFDRNGAKYIVYDESEFSGFPGCKTSLKLTKDSVRMRRIGAEAESNGFNMEMTFEKGKRITSIYETPYGSINMEVMTTSITNNLSPDGFGKVTVGYDVSLQGLDEERNEIELEIMQ